MTQSTLTRPPPAISEARRTAVLWVAGLGASLLAAAAALFVAVRWNELPPEGKLAVMVAVTAVFLAAGEALRRTLPTTGNVLFHLGALLVPVDVGAVNLRLGLSWQELLLVEGIVCTVFFGALGAVGRSKLLQAASALGVVATAFGIGATTSVPASVALATAAVALHVARPRSVVASMWAVGAGLMPILVLSLKTIDAAPSALVQLGLQAGDDPAWAIATAVLSAFVLLRAAHLQRDVSLAWFGLGAIVANGTTAWLSSGLPRDLDVVAPAAAFVVLQIGAMAVVRDPFWSRIGRSLASAGELIAALTIVHIGSFVVLAPFAESTPIWSGGGASPDRALGAAFAFVSLGWIASTLRRRLTGADAALWRATSIAAGLFAIASVQAGTAAAMPIAIAMVVVGAGLLALRHPFTDTAAALSLFYAPLTAWDHPAAAMVCGLSAAVFLTAAAHLAASDGRRARSTLLVATAIVTAGIASGFSALVIDPLGSPLVFVGACFLIAAALDDADRDVALLPRIASLGALSIAFFGWTPEQNLLVSVPMLAALAMEAVRLSDTRIAYAAIAPLHLVVAHVGLAAGLDAAGTGLVLVVASVVWAGLSEAIGRDWRRPFEAASASGLVLGVLLSATDVETLGVSLFVAGALIAAAGVLKGATGIAHVGGVAMTLGVWIELGAQDVTQLEAYAAPAALHLLIAGVHQRVERSVSSWAAYAPAIVVLGGTALIERITGGSGSHALVAGAIGVIAVVAGGARRLAGPLVLGTGVLATITIFESLAVVATIPTWAWLALAGSTLVSAAVALERAGTTPAAAGRRMVDVLQSSFD